MNTTHTAGTLAPYRSHEDQTGPYFDIDDEDAAEYAARPFTKLVTAEGVTVVNAHDLFTFNPGDAERICLVWNTLAHLDNDAVERLGKWVEQQNSDTLRDMLADEGF